MDSIPRPELEPNVLDDVVIVTQTLEKHLLVLEEVFKRLSGVNLMVKFEKCQFCRDQMLYLSYEVDEHEFSVDPGKVQAMFDIPTLLHLKGLVMLVPHRWYHRFVIDFASIVAPITSELNKSAKLV